MNRAIVAREDASLPRLFAPPLDAPLIETEAFSIDGKDFTLIVDSSPDHPEAALSVPGKQSNMFAHLVPVRR
jgi:hypothetical protein